MIQESIEYNFKKATIEDISIFYDSYVEYTNSFITLIEFKNLFSLNLKDKNYQFFIIHKKDNGSTAGCVALRLYNEIFSDKVIAEISHLYILPKFRKWQAADSLYYFVESNCKEHNISKIVVACGINSTLNQHFYTKRKFNYVKKVFLKFI